MTECMCGKKSVLLATPHLHQWSLPRPPISHTGNSSANQCSKRQVPTLSLPDCALQHVRFSSIFSPLPAHYRPYLFLTCLRRSTCLPSVPDRELLDLPTCCRLCLSWTYLPHTVFFSSPLRVISEIARLHACYEFVSQKKKMVVSQPCSANTATGRIDGLGKLQFSLSLWRLMKALMASSAGNLHQGWWRSVHGTPKAKDAVYEANINMYNNNVLMLTPC